MAHKVVVDASKVFARKYHQVLFSDHKYTVLWGGAGSGKSHFLTQKFILDLIQHPTTLLVVRKFFNTHKDTTFQAFQSVAQSLNLEQHMTFVKSPMHIRFRNGSKIIFKGGDNEEKLKSLVDIDMCWVEEATEIDYELWGQLQLRLRGGDRKKRFFVTFNPDSEEHWLKQEFFDNEMPDSLCVHSTYRDNPFVGSDYEQVMENMRLRNPRKYSVYAEGNWGRLGQQVYENWREGTLDLEEMKKDRNWKPFAGLDFGYMADPSAFVYGYINLATYQLYITQEMYEKGMLNNQIADWLTTHGHQYTSIRCDWDAGKKTVQELKRLNIRGVVSATKGPGSIQHGIQFLQSFDIIVHPSCTNIIKEFRNYNYKKNKNQKSGEDTFINEPEDSWNHALDALRYGVEPFSHTVGLATFSKRGLGI